MKKKLKKYGNSLVIVFTKEEVDSFGLVVGDVIDVPDMLMKLKRKKKLFKELVKV